MEKWGKQKQKELVNKTKSILPSDISFDKFGQVLIDDKINTEEYKNFLRSDGELLGCGCCVIDINIKCK